MNRNCLCVCLATMRLLVNVYHVILQRFTIFERFIIFKLPCFATSIYTFFWQFWMLLLSSCWAESSFAFNFFTEECRKRVIYVLSPTRMTMNAWSYERCMTNLIAKRLIFRSPDHSCYPIALSYNTQFHCTKSVYHYLSYPCAAAEKIGRHGHGLTTCSKRSAVI